MLARYSPAELTNIAIWLDCSVRGNKKRDGVVCYGVVCGQCGSSATDGFSDGLVMSQGAGGCCQ